MSEQKHTPEPWRVECDEYDDGNDGCQARAWPTVWAGDIELIGAEGFYSELGRDFDIANARRIVACVNACAGLSTEILEAYPASDIIRTPFGGLIRAEKAERQRDQLIDLVARALPYIECLTEDRAYKVDHVAKFVDEIAAAIAAVEASK